LLHTRHRRDFLIGMRLPAAWGTWFVRNFGGPIRTIFAGLAVLISGCDPGAGLPELNGPGVNAGYKLSTGDQVRVTTFGEQTLSGTFTIDDSGSIALPLLGPTPADGLTTSGLADEIGGALRTRKLLTEPNVVVDVVRYRPIFVLGEVKSPGPYAYLPHMTMLSAVAVAGGFTQRAVHDRAMVVRTGAGGTIKGQVKPEGQIEPGDVMTVLERNF
jgi:polysaccharide export outer membrane protein